MNNPRRFHLIRLVDPSGISGTGLIAWGIVWPDSTVSLRWAGPYRSTVYWDDLSVLIKVHGHEGQTIIEWLDEEWT
jgi:hypothetical protein